MRLAKVIQTYVEFKRSMGMHFHSEDCLLRAFCRAVGGAKVTPAATQAFLDGKGPVTAVWGLKFRVLRSFYRFAVSRGFATNSPIANKPAAIAASVRPVHLLDRGTAAFVRGH